jgi:hypothetical protein
MVEEWKEGDKFEVLTTKNGYYLKKGDKGICEGIANLLDKTIYFAKSQSIHIERIKKITTIYELW